MAEPKREVKGGLFQGHPAYGHVIVPCHHRGKTRHAHVCVWVCVGGVTVKVSLLPCMRKPPENPKKRRFGVTRGRLPLIPALGRYR
jgi:hypothetical protein